MIADPLSLINTFLGKVGLSEQFFDDSNGMPLSFDNTTIGVHKDDGRQMLSVSAIIAVVPPESDATAAAAAYAALLEAGLGGLMRGAGAVGLNRETGLLIYGNAIGLAGLDQDTFERFLETSVNAIEDWQDLAGQHFPRADSRPGFDALAEMADGAAVPIPV